MAKSESIYAILEGRTLDVVDGEEQFEVTLPEWFPSDITEAEINKLTEQIRFGLIAAGLQQAIIQVRAIARRENGKEDGKGDIQGAVDKYQPKAPSKSLDDEGKALKMLEGLTPEELARVLAKATGASNA